MVELNFSAIIDEELHINQQFRSSDCLSFEELKAHEKFGISEISSDLVLVNKKSDLIYIIP